jgi:hypothetical protein
VGQRLLLQNAGLSLRRAGPGRKAAVVDIGPVHCRDRSAVGLTTASSDGNPAIPRGARRDCIKPGIQGRDGSGTLLPCATS